MGTLEDQPDQDADVLGIADAKLIIETKIINIDILEIDIIEIDMPFSTYATSCVTRWLDSASMQTSNGMRSRGPAISISPGCSDVEQSPPGSWRLEI